ncbi:MAG: hypothetical protein KAH32_04590 [Chlamydiia bacterium]|nr:hypothetical protein [Chlamydiia bacterium]
MEKKKFINIQGVHRFNPMQEGINLQYGAPQTKLLLIGEDQLTDAELVIYTYMMISGYQKNRIKYRGTITDISSDTFISERSTQRAVKALQEKNLITRKKKEKGETWFIVKINTGGKSIMVLKMFLMSREIPLNLKAFVLRLAALREEDGTIDTITKADTSTYIGVSRRGIDSIQKVIPDLSLDWINIIDGMIYINFTEMNQYLIDTTTTELSELRKSASIKVKSKYRNDKLLGKRITNKGLELITQAEELQQQGHDITNIEKNIKNHRLSRAEMLIKRLYDEES